MAFYFSTMYAVWNLTFEALDSEQALLTITYFPHGLVIFQLLVKQTHELINQSGDSNLTCNAIHMDKYLWRYRRANAKPVDAHTRMHLTRCIYYWNGFKSFFCYHFSTSIKTRPFCHLWIAFGSTTGKLDANWFRVEVSGFVVSKAVSVSVMFDWSWRYVWEVTCYRERPLL